MLINMFVGKPPGNHDRILDFSTAVTGGLFFVPSADLLENLQPAVAVDDTAPEHTTTHTDADGSLGIGATREVSS